MHTRVDLYAKVHKGQRQRLFALSIEAGRADLRDESQLAALAHNVGAMLTELREHGDHEDRFIHPVLREVSRPVAEQLDSEHEGLENAMSRLEEAVRALPAATAVNPPLAGRALYLELNAFIAVYLAHLDKEEQQAMPALWSACDDARLLGIFGAFNASRAAEQQARDLMLMLPSINRYERAEVFAGMRAARGPESIGGALDGARQVLDPADYDRLLADLEI